MTYSGNSILIMRSCHNGRNLATFTRLNYLLIKVDSRHQDQHLPPWDTLRPPGIPLRQDS